MDLNEHDDLENPFLEAPVQEQARRKPSDVNDPQLADLAYHFFLQAGGAEGVAQLLFDDYRAAKPGSMIRARIIEIIVFSTKFVNTKKGIQDQGALSEEELQAQLKNIFASEPQGGG